jgi:hypothetical protein
MNPSIDQATFGRWLADAGLEPAEKTALAKQYGRGGPSSEEAIRLVRRKLAGKPMTKPGPLGQTK